MALYISSKTTSILGLLVGDGYPLDDFKCVRLGLSLTVTEDNTKHSRGKVYDGSSFDFGFEDCNKEGRYPWCPIEPDCGPPPATSVVITSGYNGGKGCWDDLQGSAKCAALCKKKLD
ncbi:hypothetical protein AAVH_17067 [Aphelenchoides avenae]|nr:hypothetical protein AAVH_17067 [Aphelenchus avenae]